MRTLSLLILIAAAGGGLRAQGDSAASADLQDQGLALKDLLELHVSVAALRAENVISTPAVVSRIDIDEYREMGLNNLVEVLSSVPGLIPIHTEIGTTTLMARGLSEFFNQKVLFMLDGVPYWQAAHGDHPLHGIPLAAVSHIEIIRGPGSVLYGTNATAAVINVVLKTEGDTAVEAATGSHRQRALGFFHSFHFKNPLWRAQVAGEYYDDLGYQGLFRHRPPPSSFPPGTPSQGTIARRREARSILAKLSYDDDLTILAHAFSSAATGLAGPARLINQSELQYDGWLLHIHKRWYGPRWECETYGDYNNFYLTIPTANLFNGRVDGIQDFDNHGRDNFRTRIGARFTWLMGQNVSLQGGSEYEHRQSGDYHHLPDDPDLAPVLTMPAGHQDETAFFAQVDAYMGPWRLLVGLRHTDLSGKMAQTQPRLAAIYHLSDVSSLKFLVSQGFNSPNFVQSGLDIAGVVRGNSQLQPEEVKTIDLTYNYATPTRVFVANLYQLRGENFILRTPIDGERGSVYLNAADFSRFGFELDYQHLVGNHRLFGNLAFNNAGDRELADDPAALFSPRWNADLGLCLKVDDVTRLGFSWRFVDEQEAAPAYHLVNVAYNLYFPRFEFKVTLANILGQDVFHADIANMQRGRISPSGDSEPTIAVEGRFKWDAR